MDRELDKPSIMLLDHQDIAVSREITKLMADAYLIEARMLGAVGFPPLLFAAAGKLREQNRFFGIRNKNALVAAAEVETLPHGAINIASLVVAPHAFRRGFGAAIVRHIIESYAGGSVEVSTANGNEPALLLYAKLGFRPVASWITDDGFHMQTLRLSQPQAD